MVDTRVDSLVPYHYVYSTLDRCEVVLGYGCGFFYLVMAALPSEVWKLAIPTVTGVMMI